ncbi:hypothetical protein [Erythrobacter litoralis]|uniref:Uncharacterized protein n=1 Tax=Erythrobacter litoralis (strain HTCC2594) TaxID=314225 RepID=Q2N986_ERYLH|nr:hypothetical protein [Erythrobacter litoralis]ABC63755.1 hypothetical protein ELI_08315 [Erythrobacter litoralis HTCC2594]
MELTKRLTILVAIACVLLMPLATQSVARGSMNAAQAEQQEADASGLAALGAVVLVALAIVFTSPEPGAE